MNTNNGNKDNLPHLNDSETTALFATFNIDELYFGIDVNCVQEVSRYQDVTEIPLASKEIWGLISLRGQIVTSIDLRYKLGLEAFNREQRPMNIIIRDQDELTNILVDEIGDVLEVKSSIFEAAPQSLTEKQRELIKGVYKLEDRLLLVLDIEKVIQSD